MSEAEILPFLSLIFRRRNIIDLLHLRQLVPPRLTRLVAPDIIRLHGKERKDVEDANRQKHSISLRVKVHVSF